MKTGLQPILAALPFFQGFSTEYVEFMAGCASNLVYEAGVEIAHEGEDANRFYIVREGKIAIECFLPGRGAITIETLGAGDVLGWSWLFPPYRTQFNSKALVTTRVIAMDGKCIRAKCDQDPVLGYQVMRRVLDIMQQRVEATRLQLLAKFQKTGG